MKKDDTIIIKAPQGTKTRWVRQSQAEGKKLSDWVMEKIDAKADAEKQRVQPGNWN